MSKDASAINGQHLQPLLKRHDYLILLFIQMRRGIDAM